VQVAQKRKLRKAEENRISLFRALTFKCGSTRQNRLCYSPSAKAFTALLRIRVEGIILALFSESLDEIERE
jgi:hypothetical protein